MSQPRGLLARLGLDRPELRAWAMYDWANSAFMTTIIAAVFPIYFQDVAAADLPRETAVSRFYAATTVSLAAIALVSPLLGAIADHRGAKKRFLAAFVAIGATAASLMALVGRGDWLLGLALFMVGNLAISAGFAFYDSLLPHIASQAEIDRVSTAGYALGYVGGGLLLAVNLAWITWPASFGLSGPDAAARLAFLSVGIWWALFSIPLFRRVPEPPVPAGPGRESLGATLRIAFGRLGATLHELRQYRQALLMVAAFLLYSDGINTIIRLATTYGTEIGIGRSDMIAALLLVQFTGIPLAFAFGTLAGWIGAKRAIFLSLVVYAGITVLGYFMRTAAHFYLLAILVGTVQGGSQALSRSLFATMIPRHKSSEFFAFFGIFEKFSGILGPFVFLAVVTLTGTSRLAVLAVMAFFVAGGLLLAAVNVPEGQRMAREAERRAMEI